MRAVILDDATSADLIARRKRLGIGKYDEVSVVPPIANNHHQDIVMAVTIVPHEVVGLPGLGHVHPGTNVSDSDDNWERNDRIPDVVVALAGGNAVDRGTHWQGGPEFLVEVRKTGDDTLAKLTFYANISVREVLVLERDTRAPALYRLARNRPVAVKPTGAGGHSHLVGEVAPLAFRRVELKKAGPRLEARHTAGRPKTWQV